MKASAKKGNGLSLREAHDATPGSSFNVPRQSGDGARNGDQFNSLDAKVAALGLADSYGPLHDPALLIKSRQAGYSSARAPAHPQQYPPRWDAGPGGPPAPLHGAVAENGARPPSYHPPAHHAPSNGYHAGHPATGAAPAAGGAAGAPGQPLGGPEYYAPPRAGAPAHARDARGFEPYYPGEQQQQQLPPAANGYGRHSNGGGAGGGMYPPGPDSRGFDQGPEMYSAGSGGGDDARPGSSGSSNVSRGSRGGARGFAPAGQPLPAGYHHHPGAPPQARPVGGGYTAGPPPAYAGQQEQWQLHPQPPTAARGFAYHGGAPQGMPPMHLPPPPPPAAAAGGSVPRGPLAPPMHPAAAPAGDDRGFAPVGPEVYRMPLPPPAAAAAAAADRGFAAYPMPPPPQYHGGYYDPRSAPPPPPPPPRAAQGLPPAAAGSQGLDRAGMAAAAAAGQPVQGMQAEALLPAAGMGRVGPPRREGPQHLARQSSASSNGSGVPYPARGPPGNQYDTLGGGAAASPATAAAAAASAALAGGAAAPLRMQQAAANGSSSGAAHYGAPPAPVSAPVVATMPHQNGALQVPQAAPVPAHDAAVSPASSTDAQQAPKAQEVKPEEPSGPRNEFAERLAQKAMANVLRAKSSLLAGEVAASNSLVAPAGAAAALPAAATAAPAAGTTSSGGEGAEDKEGPFVKPAHPFGRPRLVLKPRSLPLLAEEGKPAAAGSASASSSDDGKQQDAAGSAAANGNGMVAGRPALKLQPRTLPVPAAGSEEAARPAAAGGSGTWEHAKDASSRPKLNLMPRRSGSSEGPAAASTGAAAKASGGSNVFGAARPREEVLKERGVDPLEVEGLAERQRLSEGSLARHSGGSFRAGGSRGGSMMGSEADEEWHTVGGGARRGGRGSASGEPSLLSDVGGFRADPFFGGGSGGGGARLPPPPAKGFASYEDRGGGSHWQGHGRHSGSYGSPAGGFMERAGGGYAADDDDDERGAGVFARGLPTRHSLLL